MATPTVEVATVTAAEVVAATRNLEVTKVVVVTNLVETVVEAVEEVVVEVVTTTTAASVTIEATRTLVATKEVAALTTVAHPHPAGVETKQPLRETSTLVATATTTTMVAWPLVEIEDLEVLLSSLVAVETEVVASPTVAEVEETEVTVEALAATILQTPAADSTHLRATLTTLLLLTTTTMEASREEVPHPHNLPELEARAASTNRRVPLRLTTDLRLTVASPVPYMSATSTRVQLTLLSRLSSDLRSLVSR